MNNIAEIPLTNGGTTIVDASLLPELTKKNWSKSPNGYACSIVGLGSRGSHKKIYLHRIVNQTPDGAQTDHINGDRLDNRRENLRTATGSQNQRHSKKRNRLGKASSKFKGVYWSKTREHWVAQIRYGGKQRYLGGYDNERDAALAYNGAASLIFGDFALLNQV